MFLKDMFWTKRVVIGDGERGLVYRNRHFERVLAPGVHRLFDLARAGRSRRARHPPAGIRRQRCRRPDRRAAATLNEYFLLADIGMNEVGLV